MSTIIESIERSQLRDEVPRFDAGDRVKVHFQVVEGSRRRTQVFEGVVIARRGSGARETFTVRKQSFGVGVERVFPLHSPKIERLEVAARGDVRRAKLYYLRDRVGKAARVAERRWGVADDLVGGELGAEGALDSEGAALAEVEPEQNPEFEEASEDAEAPEEAEPAEAPEPAGASEVADAPDPQAHEEPATAGEGEAAGDAAADDAASESASERSADPQEADREAKS